MNPTFCLGAHGPILLVISSSDSLSSIHLSMVLPRLVRSVEAVTGDKQVMKLLISLHKQAGTCADVVTSRPSPPAPIAWVTEGAYVLVSARLQY